MNELILEKAVVFIKELFKNEYSGHDVFHTLRVEKTAARIAEEEGADVFTVRLAALMHDVDDVKLSPNTAVNKDRARAFMRENCVDPATMDRICQIIDEISFKGSDSVTPSTLEGRCVQDADRLDALGAIGIARTFAYGGSHSRPIYDPERAPVRDMNEQEYRKSASTSVNHFYEKLFLLKDMMNTPSARRTAEARDDYMRRFLKELYDEMEGRA